MTLQARFIAQSCAGELRCATDFVVQGLVKDSRQSVREQLYVALRGERFDGHDFVAQALAAGAAGALVDRRFVASPAGQRLAADAPIIVVTDTGEALLDLAQAQLQRLPARRVALTGSNGKTTTKEMLAAIARQALGAERVVATQGNLNNLIGMPLTALQADRQTSLVILEMGMNHPGEIARLALAAAPQVGLINNIQPAHLQGLGDLQGVAQAKGELFAALAPEAIAVVNIDDDNCVQQARRAQAAQLHFGRGDQAQLRLLNALPNAQGQRLLMRWQGQEWSAQIAHLGAHNAFNACAAAATALALNISIEHIQAGLQSAPLVPGRLQIHHFGALNVIDDTYNANPASMRAAIDVASQQSAAGRLLVALGEMGELGTAAATLHQDLGGYVASRKPAAAFFAGAHAKDYAQGALQGGLESHKIFTAAMTNTLAEPLLAQCRAGDWVLVKGSRAARSELLVEALRKQFAAPQERRD